MKPLVSVQIIHHENAQQRYLDNLIESLALQTYGNIEVLVVCSTVEPPTLPDWVRRVDVPRTTTGPQATMIGSRLAHKDAKYHLLCNDDLIFNKHAIEEMVHVAGDNPIVVNPMSNCDLGWLYGVELNLKNDEGKLLQVKRFMSFEEVEGYEEAIMEYPKHSRVYLDQQYHCMYATLVPVSLWNQLGGYDENLLMGYNDTDLSFRYKQAGVRLITCMSAFVWHYGGATTKDKPRDRQTADREYFRKKWNLPENFDGAVA